MKKPIIKIAVRADRYAALAKLTESVIESMTVNAVYFPAPSPSLLALQTQLDVLKDSIATWGPKGMRGSKKDLLHLHNHAVKMRNLLLREAACVMNLVDHSASPEAQAEFILLSGFPVKNNPSPQGILEAVRNLHHVISPRLKAGVVLLRWQRPLNIRAMGNVKVYLVFRSMTEKFSDAMFLDAATKTTFTDFNPVRKAANYYFVVAFNNKGRGAISGVVIVEVN